MGVGTNAEGASMPARGSDRAVTSPWVPEPWLPSTTPVSAAEFADVIAAHPVVVFHVWAVWDRYDREMDARLQELRPEYQERIAFYSLDVDEAALGPLYREVNLLNVPGILCYANGSFHETIHGLWPTDRLRSKFEDWLAAGTQMDGNRSPDRSAGASL